MIKRNLSQVLTGVSLGLACFLFSSSANAAAKDSKARPLRIENLSRASDKVAAHQRLEFSFDLNGFSGNPFDPEAIDVTGEFVAPSGKRWIVPAFWYQAFDREIRSGNEILKARGAAEWRLRFMPTEIGSWQVAFRARARDGTEDTAHTEFTVSNARGTTPGFVRVATNRRNFATDDGKPYVPIGLNVGWYTSRERGTQDYEEWFPQLARSGGNYARIMMSRARSTSLWWTETGTNDFTKRLDRAWQIDRILEIAEANEIRLLLMMIFHRQFRTGPNGEWPGSPYNRVNGGYLDRPEEVFTSERAAKDLKAYFRYVVARWGYSPNIFAWEIFNEVSWTDGYKQHAQRVSAWHNEMAAYIKSVDAFDHIVTSSSAEPWDPNMFGTEQLDYLAVHDYWDGPNWHSKIAATQERARRDYDKPVFYEEMGYEWRTGALTIERDPAGLHLHAGLWTGLMAGGAGTGMSWWWDSYIFPRGLEKMLLPVRRFADQVPWLDPELRTTTGQDVRASAPNLAIYGYSTSRAAYLWLNDKSFGPASPVPVAYDQVALTIARPNGSYRARWIDSRTANIMASSEVLCDEGKIELKVPSFTNDVALIIEPVERP